MPTPDLSRIRLLALDVDGVLTDGRIGLSDRGEEIKFFSVRDGLAIRVAQRNGIKLAFLSGRRSRAVERRARELEVEAVVQGCDDKLGHLEGILSGLGLDFSEVAAMGDDLPDLPLLEKAHFSAAPSDAAPEVQRQVDYVCSSPGGRGAVREVIEKILRQRGQWAPE